MIAYYDLSMMQCLTNCLGLSFRHIGKTLLMLAMTVCTGFLIYIFPPLAMLGGMTGQMFRPLGFTIVFCMTASLISAITVVPLCYMIYKPIERSSAPFSRPVEKMQAVLQNERYVPQEILNRADF